MTNSKRDPQEFKIVETEESDLRDAGLIYTYAWRPVYTVPSQVERRNRKPGQGWLVNNRDAWETVEEARAAAIKNGYGPEVS